MTSSIRPGGFGTLVLLLSFIWWVPRPAHAQVEVALGFNIAETRTNAIGLGTTLSWKPFSRIFLRGILDAEMGIPDFKEGLRYRETDREFIVDEQDVPHNPRGDELWQSQGWNMHASAYVTGKVWRISLGPGLAYNGHDGSPTSGFAFLLVGDLTSRSEIDVEFLQGGSWRLRVAIQVW